jgi:hypothetical protein
MDGKTGGSYPGILEPPSVTLLPPQGGTSVWRTAHPHDDARRQALEERKEKGMFARVVECQAKDGRGVQISIRVTDDVLPILQEQPCLCSGLAEKMLKSITAGATRR